MIRKKLGWNVAWSTLAVSLIAFSANAATWHVDDNAGPGGNGLDWDLPHVPFNNLQAALAIANPGDLIKIAQGTYKPGAFRDDSFIMKRVMVQGGYAGLGAADPDARDPNLYPTILSAEIGNSSTVTDNCYHVVVFDDSQMDFNDTRLEGVTVTGGYAYDPGIAYPYGGGILIDNGASPRVHKCKIVNNYAIDGGGGIAVRRTLETMSPASPVITTCEINNNSTGLVDGALIGGGGAGVNMSSYGGHLQLIACSIHHNTGYGNGGGVFVNFEGSNATLINCLLFENGITSVSLNDSGYGGGIGVSGIENEGGPIVNVLNCTIVGNNAKHGGGVWVNKTDDDATTLKSCIVWDNEAITSGHQLGEKLATMVVRYSDVMENDDTAHVTIGVDLGTPPDTNIGENPSTDDPDFVNAAMWDFRIGCGSPCFNTGDPAADLLPGSGGFPVDTFDVDDGGDFAEKVPTFQLLTRIESTEIDMGAYEGSAQSLCVADITGNCVVDVDDLLAVINAWTGDGPPCPAPCPANIAPLNGLCTGATGGVNVDDLLEIINNWGPCPGSGCTGSSHFPEFIEDCYNIYCDGLTGTEWSKCVSECINAVCAQDPSQCD